MKAPNYLDALTLKAEIEFTEDGFFETASYLGEITKLYVNVRAAQFDKAVRDKLIELGWTPPPEPRP